MMRENIKIWLGDREIHTLASYRKYFSTELLSGDDIIEHQFTLQEDFNIREGSIYMPFKVQSILLGKNPIQSQYCEFDNLGVGFLEDCIKIYKDKSAALLLWQKLVTYQEPEEYVRIRVPIN